MRSVSNHLPAGKNGFSVMTSPKDMDAHYGKRRFLEASIAAL